MTVNWTVKVEVGTERSRNSDPFHVATKHIAVMNRAKQEVRSNFPFTSLSAIPARYCTTA